jgi:hypothetical protein
MQWAELGSLDDLILQRLGVKTADRDPDPSEPPSGEYQTREARIRAFRARAGGGPIHTSGEVRRREARRRAREMKAVHLLSAEEIRSLFGDVAAGLAFLVRTFAYLRKRGRACVCLPFSSFSSDGFPL